MENPLPTEPIYAYHVTTAEREEMIESEGLQPNYDGETPSSFSKVVEKRRGDIDALITQMAKDSSEIPTIDRENCVYFWINRETAFEKAEALLDAGYTPLIVAVDYESIQQDLYLADMTGFTKTVDKYLYFTEGEQYALGEYTDITKKHIINTALQYLQTVTEVTDMKDIMNIIETYHCPELIATGPIQPNSLQFYKL